MRSIGEIVAWEGREMKDRDLFPSLVAEFFGPFALVFLGVGAIIMTQGQNLITIALAHGLAIGLMIMAAGHISGGHYNPAVTVSMLATGRIGFPKALMYIVVQLAGALAAAAILTGIYPDAGPFNRNAVNMGMPAVPTDFTTTMGLLMEIVLTFFLVFVVFGTAVDKRSTKVIAGISIGLTIAIDIMAGGAVSGAAMNPARWFGPAIIQQDFTNWWIWIVGPVVGGLIAALVWQFFLLRDQE